MVKLSENVSYLLNGLLSGVIVKVSGWCVMAVNDLTRFHFKSFFTNLTQDLSPFVIENFWEKGKCIATIHSRSLLI
jgi:hypothetical protein